jgi:protein tyrosine phosphatase (PTP) superfamily phosphohydrolase (DUF442 family)
VRDSRLTRRLSAASLAILAWSFPSLADLRAASPSDKPSRASVVASGAPAAADFSSIRIGNFGQVNEHYFRGAQPDGQDYRDLAAIGIKTVIDLTRDGREDEAALVKTAGMMFYRIPMTTTDRPSAEAVAQFLKLVNDSANHPVYVHCQGGRHRTGTMTALYRMTQDHWTADQAYAEMKKYKFEGFPAHPVLKSFVYDYFKQLPSTVATAAAQ